MSNITAIGMVETLGMLDSVRGADTALKSANVELTHIEKVGGGLMTFFVTGDVGAVKAAVDAAITEINSTSSVISSHVIPRLSEDAKFLICTLEKKENIKKENQSSETQNNNIDKDAIVKSTATVSFNETVSTDSKSVATTKKVNTKKSSAPRKDEHPILKRLEKMSLSKLKSMAHEECNVGNDEVKNMKKQKLINIILKHYNEKK